MSKEYANQLLNNADGQLMLAAKAVNKRIRDTEKILEGDENDDNNNNSSSNSGSSSKRQKVCIDINIKIPGLDVTLGEIITNYLNELIVNNAKSRYFFFLSTNAILDISNDSIGSQMKIFNNEVKKNIMNKFSSEDFNYESRNNQNILKKIKTGSISQLKKSLNDVENYHYSGIKEKNIKKIYEYILSMHAERSWIFRKEAIDNYSEADFQIKFWGFIFETFFSDNESIVLHWGDTMTSPCKNSKLLFKLDLRLVVFNQEEVVVDGLNGEVAKKATKKKLYDDKLKSILASKCHLNNFLNSVPFITINDIRKVYFPIIQIMGFNIHIYILKLVNRKMYVVEDVFSFTFPISIINIRSEIENIINGLSLVESLVSELRRLYETGQTDKEDQMQRIIDGSNRKKKLKVENWISDVYFDKKYDNLIENEEEEDEVEISLDDNDEDNDDEGEDKE